jgi:hypothetical protein
MTITDKIKALATEAILSHLTKHPGAERAALAAAALSALGKAQRDGLITFTRESSFGTLRSYIGTLINDLTQDGSVKQVGQSYVLTKQQYVIVEERRCEDMIYTLLSRRPYEKHELLTALISHFGADATKTPKDDSVLRSTAGQILLRLCERGRVKLEDEIYSLAAPLIGKRENRPQNEATFKTVFFERLLLQGGPFFESFVAGLLEKYFLMTGKEVLSCAIPGGADDGGIDVELETRDGLGFYEHVIVQAKCRRNGHVTETEARAFFGALTAKRGTRGIFITTATFHIEAQRFLERLDNCVPIDGNTLFELAITTGYGIRIGKEGYTFDESIFNR